MTLIANLESLFKANPCQWIDGRKLAQVAGAYAWRSRVSDLRTERKMTIRNRQRRVVTPRGSYVISEYAFVPPQPANLLEIAEQSGDQERPSC